jgi:general stress protein YciG
MVNGMEEKTEFEKQRPTPPEPNQSAYKEGTASSPMQKAPEEGYERPLERPTGGRNGGARGTAAMDPSTRQEVARKGGQAVSRNRQHMAEIGRKGGQSVSKNRDHMANIGRKGGSASRTGHS